MFDALLVPTRTWEDIREAMVEGESMKVSTAGSPWRRESEK